MLKKHSLRAIAAALLVIMALLAAFAPAQALNDFLKSWSSQYPASTTDAAGCSTCHGSSTSNLNPYGRDICVQMQSNPGASMSLIFQAVEGLNSDQDVNGASNLDEINANTQPGWTSGAVPLFSTTDCSPTGGTMSAPSGVPMPYDPVTGGDPLAVPGGPYSGNINVPVTFNGSGSYDSDGGAIVSYTWDFGDGTIGEGAAVQHTYTTAAVFPVTLTVVDDEGVSASAATSAAISGSAVLDLDITAFTASSSVKLGKSVAIALAVDNPGSVLGQAVATVTGSLNGTQVYRWQLNVYDNNKKGSTTFTFPAYTPTAKGTITWSASIADPDPDVDSASASTLVK